MDTLRTSDIDAALADLDGWTHAGDAIVKEFVFDSFRDAIDFIGRVADVADALDHHPTLLNVYARVKLTLTTHDAGGVTARDIAFAQDIELQERQRS